MSLGHRLCLLPAMGLSALMMWAQAPQAATRAQGFTIAGVTVNAVNGQPVAGTKVVIAAVTARSATQARLTGPDGRFSFAGLTAGKYSIEASAHGFREQGLNQHDNYATAVVVGQDLDASHIVFRLQPDAAIEGHIIDENNEPVENASVRLFSIDTEEGQRKAVQRETAETNDQGYYHLGHLPPGTYYLAVAARPWYTPNYEQPTMAGADPDALSRSAQESSTLDKAYPLTFYPDALDSAGASAIALKPGERFTADFNLQSMNAAHLRVRGDPNRSPQIQVKQRVFDLLEPIYGMTMSTPEPGIFHVTGLAPGHYLIEVQNQPSPNDKTTAQSWYKEFDLAGDMELSAAASPGFADISGIIRYEGSAPPQGRVFVVIRNRDGGESFSTSISSDGQFSFREDRVRPGSYDVMIGNAQGFTLQKVAASGATITGRTLDILTATTVHIAGIASHGIGQVTGTATSDGKGVAGAMVVLVPKDPMHNQPLFRRDQSDSDGTFTLANVVPGSYTVVAIADGWELEWSDPSVLQRYLKEGQPVQVPGGGGTLDVKVKVQ